MNWCLHDVILNCLFLQAVKAAGFNASFQDISNRDHFDIIEKLVEENYVLTQVKNVLEYFMSLVIFVLLN